MVTDRDGRTAIDLGVAGAPESFLVNPQGIIVYKEPGVITPQIWRREFLARLPPASPRTCDGGLVRTLAIGAVLLVALMAFTPTRTARAVDPTRLSDPIQQARYDVLIHELRCVQCENNSLADSDASIAADVRRQIREMLAAGKSDQQIKDYLVSRYSEFILFRPAYSWRNAWLWGCC